MTPAFITETVRVVTETYGADQVRVATAGSSTLVRIAVVELYVQRGQLLANGKAPKSASTVLVGGESWLQFSFNIPW